MKTYMVLLTAVLLCFLGGCNSVTPVAEEGLVPATSPSTLTPVAPTLLPVTPTPAQSYSYVKIEAPSLSNNLIGEPGTRTFYIYLPPSYHTSNTRYPVIYYLPGYSDATLLNVKLPGDVDQLIAEGTIREMMIVVVSGANKLAGSFYVNSPVTGNWEDFIVQDVVSFVDSNYRTLPQASARGISGHSMGGFGALNIAMHHPDVFSAVYSLSPGLFDENGLAESQMFASDIPVQRMVDFVDEVMALPEEEAMKEMLSPPDLFTLAYGMAFAPSLEKHPPVFDYPYAEVDGALVRDEAVWKRWERGFGGIQDEVQEYKTNWISLAGIIIDVGRNDEYRWIPKGCDYLDAQLTFANIPHTYYVHDGTHQGKLGERIRQNMLPFFSEILK